MSDNQTMLFQVIGAIACTGFLVFIAIRNRWPAVRAAVAQWSQLLTQTPGTAPAANPTSQASDATRTLLQDGRRWLIVGAPGSGKSTAARQMVRAYLGVGAEVLICDPEGAAWPKGARLVGSPDDYEVIGSALAEVLTIAQARRTAFQRGVRSFDPLLVVIDESPMVLRSTPGAIDIVADLARRGRKLAISVMLLATDTQAKTLGLEGQTKLLDSFDRLDARMTPHGVALVGDGMVLSTARLDHDAHDLVLPEIVPLPDVPQNTADRLLASALGVTTGTGSHSSEEGLFGASVVPNREPVPIIPEDSDPVPPYTNAVPGMFDVETIRALAKAGWSKNQIARKMGGRRATALERVARAMNSEDTSIG